MDSVALRVELVASVLLVLSLALAEPDDCSLPVVDGRDEVHLVALSNVNNLSLLAVITFNEIRVNFFDDFQLSNVANSLPNFSFFGSFLVILLCDDEQVEVWTNSGLKELKLLQHVKGCLIDIISFCWAPDLRIVVLGLHVENNHWASVFLIEVCCLHLGLFSKWEYGLHTGWSTFHGLE